MKKQYSLEELHEVQTNFTRALFKILEKTDIERVIAATQNIEALEKALFEVLCILPKGKKISNYFPITVNYDLVLARAIELGNYDSVTGREERYPSKRYGVAELMVELIHFEHYVSPEEILREVNQAGYRPIELRELLALGAEYPDIQREFLIIALDSFWDNAQGYRFSPAISARDSVRGLHACVVEHPRHNDWWVAVVPK